MTSDPEARELTLTVRHKSEIADGVFLFELRAIAARDDSAHRELDPIFVFFGFLFSGGRSDRFVIARTGANPSDGKRSRKNQQQESARGVRHKIRINI